MPYAIVGAVSVDAGRVIAFPLKTKRLKSA